MPFHLKLTSTPTHRHTTKAKLGVALQNHVSFPLFSLLKRSVSLSLYIYAFYFSISHLHPLVLFPSFDSHTMEKYPMMAAALGPGEDDHDANIDLPPGFRFHPSDEELVTHYLSRKVLDGSFVTKAIGDVDLNKVEPWELPGKAKMGEKEWYFFSQRDKKYPTGQRTNRATDAGYWKATGKDKEIYRAKALIGMKKTLVFYTGRAPRGEKTNWVMHEYRLDGKFPKFNPCKDIKNEWAICRVFKKTCAVRKLGTEIVDSYSAELDMEQPYLPPLMDSSDAGAPTVNTPHVSCFSSLMENNNAASATGFNYNSNIASSSSLAAAAAASSSSSSSQFPKFSMLETSIEAYLPYPDPLAIMQTDDQSILKLLLEGNGSSMTAGSSKAALSHDAGLGRDVNADMSTAVSFNQLLHAPLDDQDIPSAAGGSMDLESFLNY